MDSSNVQENTITPIHTSRKFQIFYGWYVLAACFVILFLTTGVAFSIGVMFKPFMAEFGWNRSSISVGIFINMVMYALSLIVAGRAYDRYGPKWVIVISALLISAGYMSISVIDSIWQFVIFYGILVGSGMGGTTIPLMGALLTKWFEKGRGLAVSLGIAGGCIGQFVMVPLLTVSVLKYGWRISYFSIGLVMLVVIVSLGLFVIKGDPKDLGIEPFGQKSGGKLTGLKKQDFHGSHQQDLRLMQAAKTYPFWLFLSFMFICGSGDFLVTTHLIPYVTDHDVSSIAAGNMLAWLGLLSLGGILVAGPLSDLIGSKIPIALTFVLRFLLFLLILKYQNLASFYIFSLTFGFTLMVTAPLTPILVGKLYGFSHVGLISGFLVTVHHLGGGFWSYMGGLIFDRTGSYWLAFVLSALMALVAVFCTISVREKRLYFNGKTEPVVSPP
jgi:MFS family permease